jgi:hypothetical protein
VRASQKSVKPFLVTVGEKIDFSRLEFFTHTLIGCSKESKPGDVSGAAPLVPFLLAQSE